MKTRHMDSTFIILLPITPPRAEENGGLPPPNQLPLTPRNEPIHLCDQQTPTEDELKKAGSAPRFTPSPSAASLCKHPKLGSAPRVSYSAAALAARGPAFARFQLPGENHAFLCAPLSTSFCRKAPQLPRENVSQRFPSSLGAVLLDEVLDSPRNRTGPRPTNVSWFFKHQLRRCHFQTSACSPSPSSRLWGWFLRGQRGSLRGCQQHLPQASPLPHARPDRMAGKGEGFPVHSS